MRKALSLLAALVMAAYPALLSPLPGGALGAGDNHEEEAGSALSESANVASALAGPAPDELAEVTLTGRIRLVGNARSSGMVLTDDEDQDWYIEGRDRELLSSYEQSRLTLEGKAEYRDIILANGEKAGRRRFIRNIRIIPAD